MSPVLANDILIGMAVFMIYAGLRIIYGKSFFGKKEDNANTNLQSGIFEQLQKGLAKWIYSVNPELSKDAIKDLDKESQNETSKK